MQMLLQSVVPAASLPQLLLIALAIIALVGTGAVAGFLVARRRYGKASALPSRPAATVSEHGTGRPDRRRERAPGHGLRTVRLRNLAAVRAAARPERRRKTADDLVGMAMLVRDSDVAIPSTGAGGPDGRADPGEASHDAAHSGGQPRRTGDHHDLNGAEPARSSDVGAERAAGATPFEPLATATAAATAAEPAGPDHLAGDAASTVAAGTAHLPVEPASSSVVDPVMPAAAAHPHVEPDPASAPVAQDTSTVAAPMAAPVPGGQPAVVTRALAYPAAASPLASRMAAITARLAATAQRTGAQSAGMPATASPSASVAAGAADGRPAGRSVPDCDGREAAAGDRRDVAAAGPIGRASSADLKRRLAQVRERNAMQRAQMAADAGQARRST